MREVVFLKQNEKKWKEVESVIQGRKSVHPDRLAELYIELTDDLAYAQTNYPDSNSTLYLNGLTAEIFRALYKRKKQEGNKFVKYWTTDLPLEFYKARKAFLYSFLVFTASMLIGVVSTAYDETYPRVILGDAYVDLTLENIEKGDPLGIYKDEGALT